MSTEDLKYLDGETEPTDNRIKLFESMPKESYADFILWLCLNFVEDPRSAVDVVTHPLFLTFAEYEDWCESYFHVEDVLDSLVNPCRGCSR